MVALISAGTIKNLGESAGEWIAVDLGFSEKSKSCGYAHTTAIRKVDPVCGDEKYGDLIERLKALVSTRKAGAVQVILEAPLSMAFTTDGCPVGRKHLEQIGSDTRYWYVGAGAAVMIAAARLIYEIAQLEPNRDILLFEGFVSFKGKTKAKHHDDARQLLDVVAHPRIGRFLEASSTVPSTVQLRSLGTLLGMDFDPPPIVVANVPTN